MGTKARLERRLQFRESALEKLYDAYESLVSGKVQQYTIGSRSLTKLDIAKIMTEIKEIESEIDSLSNQLKGNGKRKAVGVIPRDI